MKDRRKTVSMGFAVLISVAVFASPAAATVLVSSDFTSNDEGWKNGNFDTLTASPTAVGYSSSGGNPSGHIRVADNYSWNAFVAPAQFLGDQSAAYVGSLTFDLYDTVADSSGSQASVMLSDGTTFIYSPTISLPAVLGPPFNSFSVSLLASAGWRTDPVGGGSAVSEATLQSVLANLQTLAIDADWRTGGDDDVHLDNVALNSVSSVPEPSACLLLAAGLLGLRRYGWRGKRTE